MSQQLETKQSIKAEKKANQQWTQNPSEFGMRNSECGKNQKSVLIENDSLLSNQHLPNKENQQWNQQELAKLLDIKPIVNSEDESQTAEKNILIPHSEFLIPHSNEEPHKKKTAIPWSENGFAITIVVGLLVAGLFGVGGFLLKTLASSNKEKSLTPIAETKAVPEEELSPDGEDIGWLKTKLALAQQGEQIKAAASQSEPKISLKSSIPRKSEVRSQKSEVNNSEFQIPNSEFKKPPGDNSSSGTALVSAIGVRDFSLFELASVFSKNPPTPKIPATNNPTTIVIAKPFSLQGIAVFFLCGSELALGFINSSFS